jgi:hypothetical protein
MIRGDIEQEISTTSNDESPRVTQPLNRGMRFK